MNNTNYTKEALNRAIFKVLTTKFKKDAKESHRIVEDVGYEIIKWDGSFQVTNPNTNRYVRIEETQGFYTHYRLRIWTDHKEVKSVDELKAVDFVGQLETTRKPYYEPYETESEAYLKYRGIKNADYWAESADKHIKEILDKLSSLQKDLIYYTEEKAKYEAKAKSLRKEYGLI